MDINKEYQSHKSIIYKQAIRYAKMYEIDFVDTLSDANEQFCIAFYSFSEKKRIKFSTWLWNSLNYFFLEKARSIQRSKRTVVSSDLAFSILKRTLSQDQILKQICLLESYNSISEESQNIIDLILESGKESITNNYGHITKRSIKKYLLKNNWSDKKIDICFNEIIKVINENRNIQR
jgi:hypothetical protein